jgi:V8-like Glu-specific endopeptidase
VGKERAGVKHGRARRLWRSAAVVVSAVCLVLVVEKTPVTSYDGSPQARATGNAEAQDRSTNAAQATAVPPALTGAGPSNPLQGTAFTGFMPQVGALFSEDGNGNPTGHFCTASVVDSPHGDVIATAAHCVIDPTSGQATQPFLFAPGYHDGAYPYGLWSASQVIVDTQWSNGGNPDYDVAFVVLKPNAAKENVQGVVGSDRITFGDASAEPGLVGVIGYPGGTDQPIACLNTTKPYNPNQSEFDCAGYQSGSSGGPLLQDLDSDTGEGTLVGVIGGYEEGGDTPDVSYAAHFTDSIKALYQRAVRVG